MLNATLPDKNLVATRPAEPLKGMLMYQLRRANSELSENCSCCIIQYKNTHFVIYGYIYIFTYTWKKKGVCVYVLVNSSLLLKIKKQKESLVVKGVSRRLLGKWPVAGVNENLTYPKKGSYIYSCST